MVNSIIQQRTCRFGNVQTRRGGQGLQRAVSGISRQPLAVRNAFTLSSVFKQANKAVSPAGAAAVSTMPVAENNIRRPKKAVESVPVQVRSTVELVMVLTSLAAQPSAAMAAHLSEHHLRLVTTSATCDDMFGSALDTFSEEFGESGDGMAMPMSDIRAASEKLAAQVGRTNMASEWNPARSQPDSSFSNVSTNFTNAPDRHTLEQLMAQADYNRLSGNSTRNSADASKLLAHVQALQSQIKQAAATVVSKPGQQQEAQSKKHTANSRIPAASAKAGVANSTADEDVYGDGAAMPVLPSAGVAASMPSFGAAVAARKAAAAQPSYPVYEDPASAWMVLDSTDGQLRHIVIQAPESLSAAVSGTWASSDLATFENYSMGAKINRRLYKEANALYNRFIPLILDHLEERPDAKVMLSGSGVGGSLAAILLLMLVARGMRPSAFAPVYTLNAPAVLCEVPDFKQWCSKDGCSLADMDGMMEEVLHRGILSQLGLSQDAIRNIYHQKTAAEAAVQAVNLRNPLRDLAATSSKQLSSMVQQWDITALKQSPFVPEVLKTWLRSEATGVADGFQRLHILNPVGKMMLYVGASS